MPGYRGRLLSRQLQLLAYLQNDGYQSLRSLARKLVVSTRTIRRDLAGLEEAHFAVMTAVHEDGVRRWKLVRKTCPLCGTERSLSRPRS